MLSILVYIIVLCLVIGIVYWLIDVIPVPQPINRFAKILIIVVGMLALIWLLLGVAGNPPTLPR